MKKMIRRLMPVFAVIMVFAAAVTAHAEPEEEASYISREFVRQTGATETSVTVSWDRVEGAESYAVSYASSAANIGKDNFINVGSKRTYTVTGLKKQTTLYFSVMTSDGESDKPILDVIKVSTSPEALKGFKVKSWSSDGKTVIVQSSVTNYTSSSGKKSYDKVTNGFEWQILNRKGRVVDKGSSDKQMKLKSKKVSSKSVYRLRVRGYASAYRTKEKLYGPWAVFPLVPSVQVKTAGITGGKLRLRWQKVLGAKYYDIYVSRKAGSGYRKVRTVKGSRVSAAISEYRGKKFVRKAGRSYYFYVSARTKVSGKEYKSWKKEKMVLGLI